MKTYQIFETIEDIYGFEAALSYISHVNDKILPSDCRLTEPTIRILAFPSKHYREYMLC